MKRRWIAIGLAALLLTLCLVVAFKRESPLERLRPYMVAQNTFYSRRDNSAKEREDHMREVVVEIRGLTREQLLDILHREYPASDGWNWENPNATAASHKDFSWTVGFWEKRGTREPHFVITEQKTLNIYEYWLVRAKHFGVNPFTLSPSAAGR